MDIPEDNHLLDYLVEKCAQHMYTRLAPNMYLSAPGGKDYDILQAVQTETGWTIVLDPAKWPQLFVFDYKQGDDKIRIETFVKAYVHRIAKF